MTIRSYVNIMPNGVSLNGNRLETNGNGAELLTNIYRERIGDYPKFFKMDALCRLGFVASELLLQCEKERLHDSDERAIIFFNSTSSVADDKRYQSTIDDMDQYFPSPAIFVYTLPNIVTGEIAIRNKYFGETSFYVLPQCDADIIQQTVEEAFADSDITSAICGWIDCANAEHFEAKLMLVDAKSTSDMAFNRENINKIMK